MELDSVQEYGAQSGEVLSLHKQVQRGNLSVTDPRETYRSSTWLPCNAGTVAMYGCRLMLVAYR